MRSLPSHPLPYFLPRCSGGLAQPWRLLRASCAAASGFTVNLATVGAAAGSRLWIVEPFFAFFPIPAVGNLTPPYKWSCQLVPHLRRHPPAHKRFSLSKRIQSTGMVFTLFPLSACFLRSLLSSGSSAISLLGSCFSLPGSELSSPSWPSARPSCFPDPVFRQG